MTPINVSGFNRDLVVENTASSVPYNPLAVELNPGEGKSFYQSGLIGKSFGLPVSGGFTSEADNGTVFQFQPYTGNNALLLSSSTAQSSGTLSLLTPGIFGRIAVLAHSASGGGPAAMIFNFNDGSSFTTNYDAPDWFGNIGFALQGMERIGLSDGASEGAPGNPRFYQTTIDLAAQGLASKSLSSVTFEKAASAGATAIYALSGEAARPSPAAISNDPASIMANELETVTFIATVTGSPVPALQWVRGGNPILTATNSTYSIPAVSLSDNGAAFRLIASNVVSNISYVVTSGVATLTVRQDTNRPSLLGAESRGLNAVLVRFSERIRPATATNFLNYSISGTGGNVAFTAATLDASQSNVVLTTQALVEGAIYTVTVNNLSDQSFAANVIASNSYASFTASTYIAARVGTSFPPGDVQVVPNGLNVSGGGEIGGTADQFQFSYAERTGDFDLKVRVDSLTLADAWSKAGMIAREGLAPGARSAGVMATPSISGSFFQSRALTNDVINITGSLPVSYPNTWLRLKRAGNSFYGYAGFDGQTWAQLGEAIIALPSTIYLGFAVASARSGQLSTAAFRDFSNVTNPGVAAQLTSERLGQSSRRTSLVISEIMYHPANPALEFVEIFNTRGEPQDISGYQLGGDIQFTFPAGTLLPGGGFAVVAKSPPDLQSAYGLSGVFGPFANSLPNGSGTVRLLNGSGAIFLEAEYRDAPPWPVAADGGGHSLILARPSCGENNPLAWAASDSIGGSPGKVDPISADGRRNVVINEFLAHTDLPAVDYLELYNRSAQPVDISGCILTDDAGTNKFVIAPGTVIPARGFISYQETALNFALNAAGETIYFKNGEQTRVLDAVRFEGQENGVATGRHPDGGDQFYRLAAKTPGTTNAAIRIGDVVINELMYHPISGDDDDQYIELHNRGATPVDLGGWTLQDGISYTFPAQCTISAGGYIVVAKNSLQLLTKYPALNSGNTLGNFSGKLSGSGERVALAMPDTITSSNAGVFTTNLISIVMDEVTYGTGGRWPSWADGGGSSLELVDAGSDPRLPSNWADSDETQKAPWTQISTTGTIDNGNVAADQLQVLQLGAGESLIDSVEVFSASSGNLVANSTFEGGASGWTASGTEAGSSLETSEGFSSSRSYHVRAVERGDNQINRVRTPLSSPLAAGTTGVTIRARVRWLKGHPEILLRLRGNWLECAGEMALPVAPGTPGARNSRFVTNAPPGITGVKHFPILPAAAQAIVISARVDDPDGIAFTQLKYRLDPAATYTTLTMNDNGINGDAVALDGIYSATVPSQSAGATIAYYVESADGFSPAASGRFPNDAPVRECLVRFGEVQPAGNFPVYRIWMTQATLNLWTSRHKLDNTPLDITFVSGDERVIYNATALYAGSPYISGGYSGPASGKCGYSLEFPKDDLFLGDTDLVLDWPGGHGNESTAMQEQLGYWIAEKLNLPFSHRYTIRLHVNGVTDEARQTVFEAAMQPGKSFVEQWSPDAPGGQFFKIERAFEFSDGGGLIADPQPRLQNFTTTGGAKKKEKYRWNFAYRATDRMNDYDSIFALVDALNAPVPEPYTSSSFGQVDVEEWMGIFATEHIIANFDSYGHDIGKNMYAYKPDGGLWQLYMFDLDWLMLAAQNYGYTASSAPLFNSEDPVIARMYAFPPMSRAYWRAVQDAINGPFDPANYVSVMDAKYNSLVANGVSWSDGNPLTAPTAVKSWFSQRRAALQVQLADVNAPFFINPSIVVSNGVGIITGTAPIEAKTLRIAGANWPVTWTTITNWTATVPLATGGNVFSVVGIDPRGQPVAGASNSVSVIYGGTNPSPINVVVINEIMLIPATGNAGYIELFNTSSNFTFDLSGWNLNGLSYDFPNGTFLAPQKYLVLAKDRIDFNNAYGASVPVFDVFMGTLQADGETLSLLAPGAAPASPMVVDRVRYETNAPWPAPSPGSSLQVVDATRDNGRVAVWRTATNPAAPGWIYFSTNGTATSSRLYIYLQSAGDIYVDDINIVAGGIPDAGINRVSNSGFESTLAGSWNLTANFSQSAVSTAEKHSGNSSLHVIAAAAGSGSGNSIYQDISPALTTSQTYSLSFWYHQTANGGPLTIRLSGANPLGATINPGVAVSSAFFTPGAVNSVAAKLAEFPAFWLNELQSENLSGPTDNFSQRDPWIEIYNAGTNALSLANFYLSDDYTNLAKWAFPSNAVVPPEGFALIWCDNQTNQSTANVFHTSFRLAARAGSVALSRSISNAVQIVDYLNYTGLPANWSYGDVPDGQPFYRRSMFFPTPNATNSSAAPPISVFINEWMADNSHTLADPADGNFEDWFEIFNPGTNAVDLGGYYLTDTLTNKTKFLIPNNGQYLVPAGGFLLVWADDEVNQNATNNPDLHAGFALGKSGEAIGLFSADGEEIDSISFGAQTSDESEGRFPDGVGPTYRMATPTPRASNVLENTEPDLGAITNRIVTLGQTLALTASATDADIPAQTLTYTLGTGAPSGATIQPASGLFSWTPNAAPATNIISVVVRDDGTPSLSATQSFVVTVYLPPTIGVQLLGNQIQLNWSRGTLQQADDVSGPYTDVTSVSPATISLSATQKYFRVRIQ